MNYVSLHYRPGRGAARLGTLLGVDDDYELLRGIPRAAGFPGDARFEMHRNFPDRLLLEDVVQNGKKLLVVSERLRGFLQEKAARNNEFLPVTIINHKKRKEKDPYFIAHQVTLQDCIDLDQSEYERNDIDPDLFASLDRLVLDEARIDPDVTLFRMAGYPFVPIFRRDLAEALAAQGFTGLGFDEISDWTGF